MKHRLAYIRAGFRANVPKVETPTRIGEAAKKRKSPSRRKRSHRPQQKPWIPCACFPDYGRRTLREPQIIIIFFGGVPQSYNGPPAHRKMFSVGKFSVRPSKIFPSVRPKFFRPSVRKISVRPKIFRPPVRKSSVRTSTYIEKGTGTLGYRY